MAQGEWDSAVFPAQHAALTRVIEALKADRRIVPLSFPNIYETSKINDPVRRLHLARVQSTISGGKVIRGRRRILEETLLRHIVDQLSLTFLPCRMTGFCPTYGSKLPQTTPQHNMGFSKACHRVTWNPKAAPLSLAPTPHSHSIVFGQLNLLILRRNNFLDSSRPSERPSYNGLKSESATEQVAVSETPPIAERFKYPFAQYIVAIARRRGRYCRQSGCIQNWSNSTTARHHNTTSG
ncbi:MAG: hypothetical protein H0T56_13165 [Pseudaminobacter sp.]|nr:hypothetical protein [Pseudaminobacter sp.]